jgi:hypothetical protein
MAKVGRAARVASKQRLETITASKTITAAETGELYIIKFNGGTDLTITLPPKSDGAYFKFIFGQLMEAAGSTVKITSNEDTDGDMIGSIFEVVVGGADAASAVQTDDGADHQVTLSNNIQEGSVVECYCDGSVWYVTGLCAVEAAGKCAFGT